MRQVKQNKAGLNIILSDNMKITILITKLAKSYKKKLHTMSVIAIDVKILESFSKPNPVVHQNDHILHWPFLRYQRIILLLENL